MKSTIKIDIVSDVVCPWCYIGKRRLEKAMEKLSDSYDFDVTYHPFELNPNTSSSGVDQKEYLVNKFGSEERYNELTSRVTDVAALDGIEMNYAAQTISPNTRRLHSLIRFAGTKGLDRALAEVLFNAYFTSGIDLSKEENILKAALEAGLDEDDAKAILNSEDEQNQTAIEEQRIYEMGITGVPFFIINEKYGISGAQSAETFEQAFLEIGRESLPKGEACDTDKKNC